MILSKREGSYNEGKYAVASFMFYDFTVCYRIKMLQIAEVAFLNCSSCGKSEKGWES